MIYSHKVFAYVIDNHYIDMCAMWQIQSLLNDRRVNEALELVHGVHKTGLSKDKFNTVSVICPTVFYLHSIL